MGTATVHRFFLFLACSFLCQLYAANEFITKLVLYDTSVNPGGNLGPIVSGMTIDLATTGTKLTIVAQINSTIDGYVYFKFDEAFTNKENSQFYALNGNSGSYLNAFAPLALIGEHTLVADFYNVQTNELLDTTTSTLNVIDSGTDKSIEPLTGFTLLNTITGNEVTLPSVVDLNKHGKSLSIIAYTQRMSVHDVVFLFDNEFVRVEKSIPWAVNGNEGARIFPFGPMTVPGVHTVTAVATGVDEETLGNLTVTFTVRDEAPTQAPFGALTPSPTNRPTFRAGRPTFAPSHATTSSPTRGELTIMPTRFKRRPSSLPVFMQSTEPSQAPRIETSYNPTTLTSVVPTLGTAEPTGVLPLINPTMSPVPSFVPTDGKRVELNETFYIAFISLSDVEPTTDEYKLMEIAIEEYYNGLISAMLTVTDPLLEFNRIEMNLNSTQHNAGIPDDRFNIYMEYRNATAVFAPSSTGILITSDDLIDLLIDGITREFLLDTVRIQTGTPFADVVEVFLNTDHIASIT